jgi:hypothetical protein
LQLAELTLAGQTTLRMTRLSGRAAGSVAIVPMEPASVFHVAPDPVAEVGE